MNIAFDAKRAFTNFTGLGQYSRTLIESLAVYYPGNEYFLCTPKRTNRFAVSTFTNMHILTPQQFPSSFFTSAWRSSWVKNNLKQLSIDLYHGLSHEIPLGINKTGIKTVVTIHDLIFERYAKQYSLIDVRIYRKKFRYACEHANTIIAISHQTKDDIIQFYKIPEQKITVCYQSCNPIFAVEINEEEKQRIKKQYKLPDTFFLYVGSIIERKNLLTICKALFLLKGKLDIPLVVIGLGGKYKHEVQEFINENDLASHIIFLSDDEHIKHLPLFQSAADFPAIFQQALCMIYPSVFEGFGIPVLEALYSRVPVITSNISSLPEAGGEGALYIDPLSPEQMANTMMRVALNTELRKHLIDKGWQHAQNFTREKCAKAVMEVYQKLF